MRSRIRLLIIFISFVIIIIMIITLCGLILFLVDDDRHLRDEKMISIFYQKRDKFIELLDMMHDDQNLCYIDNDHFDLTAYNNEQLSFVRLKKYRILMKEVEVKMICKNKNGDEIKFYMSLRGFASMHNSFKGFIYIKHSPDKNIIYSDLNKYSDFNIKIDYGVRRIENNWYLFYENE